MNTAIQYFSGITEGQGISLGQLLRDAKRYGCLRYAYEIESASNEHITYKVYLQLDHKKTVSLDLTQNKDTGTTTVKKKQMVDWVINWSKLRKSL
jgi:hypothetical protein